MLSVSGLETFYGPAQALFDVGFDVPRGRVVALLGRNGAGKSTTLKSIMGLVSPARGRIVFAGQDVVGLRPHQLYRLGLGYVPEERRIFTGLTVEENLTVGQQPPRPELPPWTAEKLYALFPNLTDVRRRLGGQISGGEQQMLTIARTLMGNPLVLLLDEPSTGLAPRITAQLAQAILDLRESGLTVLLSEQNLRFAAAIADHAVILETGRVRWSGAMTTLDSATKEALLTV
ncbi:MAG: ABC transporter ATP-binding protein [Rhodospirillales bacterium]|nr:ABC transporter ATP-binding protein [Rhodospirillales bacterium]